MDKKAKKKALKKNKVVKKIESEKEAVAVVEDIINSEEYIRLKKEKEEEYLREKAELERLEAIRKEEEEIVRKNVEKAQKYLEAKKADKTEIKVTQTTDFYKESYQGYVELFNNYSDRRMKQRREILEITNKIPEDFRFNKYIQVNKLPTKPRTAKLETLEQVETMLVASKKEILTRSGRAKAIKKAKLSKEDERLLNKLFLDRMKLDARMIVMFQPKDSKIPMYELYWAVQNTITSYQKMYDSKNKTPFKILSEFDFCDSVIWSLRYFLEMVYTDKYPIGFLKKDALTKCSQLYQEIKLRKGIVTALDAETATVEFAEKFIRTNRYSPMIINYF